MSSSANTEAIIRRLDAIEAKAAGLSADSMSLMAEAAGLRDIITAEVSTPASSSALAARKAVNKRNKFLHISR